MEIETEANMGRWSELPAELLRLISRKMTEPSDYVRFRSVCKPWRSIARLTDFPKQVWLLLPYDLSSCSRSFFNPITKEIRSLDLPQARGKAICGSSHGWLFLQDEAQSLILLNPITKAHIVLPPTTQLPFDGNHLVIKDPICISNLWDISLTSYPTNADCTVAVSHANSAKLALCKLGSPDWTILDTSLPYPVRAFLCRGSHIYAIDQKGAGVVVCCADGFSNAIWSVSISSPIEPSSSFFPRFYMLGDSDGEILLVADSWRASGAWEMIDLNTCGNRTLQEECVEIFRLRPNELDGELEWCRVGSLGDLALFLSENKSSVVSVRAADSPGIREDFVYFDSPHLLHWEFRDSEVHHLSFFDVKENSFDLLSCQWKRPQETCVRVTTWFTPSLC